MFGFIKKLFGIKIQPKEPLPPKDPMDWSLTPSSTDWNVESYCPNCESKTKHEDLMSSICSACGYFDQYLIFKKRVTRKIWNGTKWVVQRKYGNGPKDYTLED